MDPNFWLERWQKNEIGFHANDVQPALVKHWPKLKLVLGTNVLVPLCGKSIDMVWLVEQGHKVIGAELSELAIDAFFAEQKLMPAVTAVAGFVVKSAGPYELWCGDFFALPKASIKPITAIYDRAALVAMPPALQPKYAAKLVDLAEPNTQILLIGLDYNTVEIQGPPFSTPQAQVRSLFENNFDIAVLDVRDGLAKSEHLKKRGVTRLEEATYLLRRQS